MKVVMRIITMSLAVAVCCSSLAFAQKRGGTLVQITQPEPPSLASYISSAVPIGQVTAKIYDGLLEYGFDLKPRPSLAESWKVAEDGRSITFSLRRGVKFHDGKPFTSADVKFTIMEVLKKVHPRGILTFQDVTDVETPDELTAILKLANPAPYMLSALSGFESPMLPKHVFSIGDIKLHHNANRPIGTGPFKFVEWRRGEFVRLDRNSDYWRPGLPYLDRIVIRFINDESIRTAALERGEAHVAGFGAVPYNDAKKLSATPSLEVTKRGYEMVSPIVELLINTRKPPFDNPKVRQAIAYVVDRQFVVDNIWFGFGKPATGPISSNFSELGYYQTSDGVEKANRLLDEAGLRRNADGVRLEIMHDIHPYGPEWQRFGEYVQQRLALIGIKATIRYEDVPRWLKRVYSDYDFDISSNFLLNLSDPVLGVHRAVHSRMIKQGTVFVNGSRWSSEESDKLMDAATIESDQARRSKLYHDMQRKVVEASPIVWVFEWAPPTVIDKRFKNVISSPLGIYSNFATVWRE
jgi:peptide/nickel transport system substrate-binding protein